MGVNKLAIVHFQPVEQYPPLMNLIRTTEQTKQIRLEVYTTSTRKSGWQFASGSATIKRLAKQAGSSFVRYTNYALFNGRGILSLLLFRPGAIICYETYSVFPVWLYMKFFPGTKLLIHYHEYSSPLELLNYSGYLQWLARLERVLLRQAYWISHTNADRLAMFQKEHLELNSGQLKILPNYPPRSWYEGPKSQGSSGGKKMVYVGALSLDTMYTEDVCNWIVRQNGLYTLDIYSDNYTQEAEAFLNSLDCPLIRLHKGMSYYELPQVLRQYEIGLVIYNGHIPNYVYNVPNKVYEYYACGLEIWCSKDLISVISFKDQEQIQQIRIVDFAAIDQTLENEDSSIEKEDLNNQKIFSAEAEYCGLLQSI
jgi:hypothetical protein